MLMKEKPPFVLSCHWYPVALLAAAEKAAFSPSKTAISEGLADRLRTGLIVIVALPVIQLAQLSTVAWIV